MSEYCLPIERLEADDLIEKVLEIEAKSDELKYLIKRRTVEFRAALEQQYEQIIGGL